ncbi:YqiA/YcfP family alpha/beta fold hydrolase [Halomicronema sp. CCY15110]|uniref:YqiA/YcfP family alpha/beta fold hydrolase n=1 Tax=Halomicronema sp. CCY15110 TaxID=2767773 RepID=UPI00194DB09D|nr:YqiA/YcfP family alpha/beta fold hydrolase [Halomicronema sp. CCY15110]
MEYLYLHGFASGPQSAKAQYLRQQFAQVGKTLHILDLNQGDFTHLTLSRQIEQAIAWIGDRPQVSLIGSSFGGLTAGWIAEQPQVSAQIQQLVLLAPAFQFLAQWLPRLGAETVAHWRETGRLAVYHYGQQQQVDLAYDFITDAQQYDEAMLQTALPTLIFHGRHDDVISIQASRDYAAHRPWVQLIELDSDHTLGNVQSTIWATLRSRRLL